MSRVDELIAEFCPQGVEYKKIKDVFTRVKGTPITATKMKQIVDSDGDIRIFAGGKTVIDAFEKDIPNANITRVPAVLIQSRGVIDAVYYDKPFTFKNEMWAYTSESKDSVKFLFYLLKNNLKFFRDSASGMGSLPQISLKVTEEFKVPVPPIVVQRAIVDILDKFTALEAELEAELEARKQQYEHYRKELLTFGDDVTWSTLGNVSLKVSSGGTPTKSIKRYYQAGNIPWLRTQEVNFSEVWKTKEFITAEAVKETSAKWIPEDCLIVAISGASAGRVAINKIPLTTNQHCCNLQIDGERVNCRFAFHWVSSKYQELKSLGRGARSDLNSNIIQNFPIPIPSLDEQYRIVELLDKFDSLVNDLSSGIPAELMARRQQYEYYRDELLTFKELVS